MWFCKAGMEVRVQIRALSLKGVKREKWRGPVRLAKWSIRPALVMTMWFFQHVENGSGYSESCGWSACGCAMLSFRNTPSLVCLMNPGMKINLDIQKRTKKPRRARHISLTEIHSLCDINDWKELTKIAQFFISATSVVNEGKFLNPSCCLPWQRHAAEMISIRQNKVGTLADLSNPKNKNGS